MLDLESLVIFQNNRKNIDAKIRSVYPKTQIISYFNTLSADKLSALPGLITIITGVFFISVFFFINKFLLYIISYSKYETINILFYVIIFIISLWFIYAGLISIFFGSIYAYGKINYGLSCYLLLKYFGDITTGIIIRLDSQDDIKHVRYLWAIKAESLEGSYIINAENILSENKKVVILYFNKNVHVLL